MTASLVDNWPLIVAVTAVVIVMLLLLSKFAHRDPGVRRTRYGFFVERDRFDDEPPWPQPGQPPPPWPVLHPRPEEQTLPWPAAKDVPEEEAPPSS